MIKHTYRTLLAAVLSLSAAYAQENAPPVQRQRASPSATSEKQTVGGKATAVDQPAKLSDAKKNKVSTKKKKKKKSKKLTAQKPGERRP